MDELPVVAFVHGREAPCSLSIAQQGPERTRFSLVGDFLLWLVWKQWGL